MPSGVRVAGLKELGDAFNLAPQKLERRALANATRAGGNVFKKGAERRAPKLSGDMARNVSAKFKVFPGKGIATAIIGVIYRGIRAATGRHGHAPSSEDPGVYSLFVEGIRRRPNQTPEPFMRPTFDEDSDAAVNAFADKLRSQLGDLVK